MDNPWLVTIIGGFAVVLLTWFVPRLWCGVRFIFRAIAGKFFRKKESIQFYFNFGEGKEYRFVVDAAVDKKARTCESCIYSAFYDGVSLECRRHAPARPCREDQTQFSIVGCDDFCGDYEPKNNYGGIK